MWFKVVNMSNKIFVCGIVEGIKLGNIYEVFDRMFGVY